MHRSGASAASRICNLLGADLGPHLLPPRSDNETGTWEHRDVDRIHEELLAAIGSAWDDIRAMPDAWVGHPAVAPARRQLAEVLRRDFAGSPLWCVKDPRLCRLLPLWLPVLDDLGCAASFVLITRNPLEVAGSLARRNGFPVEKSCLLWLRHLIEAERATRAYPRAFMTYDGLLRAWRQSIAELSDRLDISWPCPINQVAREIDGFLSKGLRHEQIDDVFIDTDRRLSRWLRDAYRTLRQAVDGDDKPLKNALATIADQIAVAATLFEPWIIRQEQDATETRQGLEQRRKEHESLQAELAGKSAEIDARTAEADDLRSQLDAARAIEAGLEARLAELDRELARQHDALRIASDAAQAAIDSRDKQIEDIIASRSWRLSTALRLMKRWARAVPGLLPDAKATHGRQEPVIDDAPRAARRAWGSSTTTPR